MNPTMPKPPQAAAPAGAAGAAAGEPEVIRNLMVNYVPTTIDEVQLRQLFEMYGPIESVKIVCDRETRTSKGYGFVKYRFAFSAVHAIQYLNGYPLMNKRLKVAYSNQAEAQKALMAPPTLDPSAYGHAYGLPASAEDTQAAWQAAHMSYMQMAALQQLAMYSQPHAHAHAHPQGPRPVHAAPQQPQQPHTAAEPSS